MLAAMDNDTSVSELCTELGITPITLYRYVGPDSQLRAHGPKILLGRRRPSLVAGERALRGYESQFGMQNRSSRDRTDRQIA